MLLKWRFCGIFPIFYIFHIAIVCLIILFSLFISIVFFDGVCLAIHIINELCWGKIDDRKFDGKAKCKKGERRQKQSGCLTVCGTFMLLFCRNIEIFYLYIEKAKQVRHNVVALIVNTSPKQSETKNTRLKNQLVRINK